MRLPGGLLRNGKLINSYRFSAITGELELVLAESGLGTTYLPEQITGVLESTLETIGTEKADIDLVRELSVGDRQFLMLQLAKIINITPRWITQSCQQCEEKFQFIFDLDRLPVKTAGEDYPQKKVKLSTGLFLLRTPNGLDQEVIATAPDEITSRLWLMNRLLLSIDEEAVDITFLTENDFQIIDDVIEDISVEIAQEIEVDCPECSALNQCPLSPYEILQNSTDSLFSDIHTLAMNYHWHEAEILALPRYRRKHYLQMVENNHDSYDARAYLAMQKGVQS